jgi:hypothetical protein
VEFTLLFDTPQQCFIAHNRLCDVSGERPGWFRFKVREADALAARFGGERVNIPHLDTDVVLLHGHGRVKTITSPQVIS